MPGRCELCSENIESFFQEDCKLKSDIFHNSNLEDSQQRGYYLYIIFTVNNPIFTWLKESYECFICTCLMTFSDLTAFSVYLNEIGIKTWYQLHFEICVKAVHNRCIIQLLATYKSVQAFILPSAKRCLIQNWVVFRSFCIHSRTKRRKIFFFKENCTCLGNDSRNSFFPNPATN